MRILKKILWLLLIVIIIAQFFKPKKNQGTTESTLAFIEDTNPPENVKLILKESCFDCHSDTTRYPWYFNVTPVNYWMDYHIKDGKKHFNVSAWKEYSVKKKDHKLEELLEMIEEGEMPLDSYTWLHGNLSENETKLLLQWAIVTRLQYKVQIDVSSN